LPANIPPNAHQTGVSSLSPARVRPLWQEMTMSALEQRVRRLEDLEQITGITMQLARHFDNSYHADGVVSLFTDDGVFDGGPFGRYEGLHAIHGFFDTVTEQITFAKHHLATHAIHLAGNATDATGQWYMWGTHTIAGEAMFLA